MARHVASAILQHIDLLHSHALYGAGLQLNWNVSHRYNQWHRSVQQRGHLEAVPPRQTFHTVLLLFIYFFGVGGGGGRKRRHHKMACLQFNTNTFSPHFHLSLHILYQRRAWILYFDNNGIMTDSTLPHFYSISHIGHGYKNSSTLPLGFIQLLLLLAVIFYPLVHDVHVHVALIW